MLRQTTSFIGRENEIARLLARLDDPACQLLTLVGPGGVGKTRLALELAERKAAVFPDSVWFIPLQSLQSVSQLIPAIFDVLSIQMSRAADPQQQLFDYLRDRQALLVLDNFEHLPDGAQTVSDILTAMPRGKILVTSRHTLNLREEWIWLVHGMAYPKDSSADSIEDHDAVRLFAERAAQVRPDFTLAGEVESVTAICQMVEGLPLALELAASWTKTLSCWDIMREIKRGLDFLTTNLRNMPERHRSMHAVFEQTWKQLTSDEQAVFQRLSVFRGGFTAEAAQQVTGASLTTLARLVEKSLVQLNSNQRYDLHELLRQYGEGKLAASGEGEVAHEAHARCYLDMLPTNYLIFLQHGEQPYLPDLDNLRVAIDWAAHHGRVEWVCEKAAVLYDIFGYQNWYAEGAAAFGLLAKRVRDTLTGQQQRVMLERLLIMEASLYNQSYGNYEKREVILTERALALLNDVDDHPDSAFALFLAAKAVNDVTVAAQLFEEAQARFQRCGQDWGVALVNLVVGFHRFVEHQQQDEGLRLVEQTLATFQTSDAPIGIMQSLYVLSEMMLYKGDFDRAAAYAERALRLSQDLHQRLYGAHIMIILGETAAARGDYEAARKHYLLAQPIIRATGVVGDPYLLLAQIKWMIGIGQVEQAAAFTAVLVYHSNIRPPTIQRNMETIKAELQACMPPEAFAAAWARGEALNPDDVEREMMAVGLTARAVEQHDSLTEREREVLGLLVEGLSNAQIAGRLFVTIGTVKTHLHSIYSKLAVTNRVQAITRAEELRLL